MAKKLRRTPRGYDDVAPTGKELAQLLPEWLSSIEVRFQDRPDQVFLAWKEVIGEKLAPMTHAVSFIDGVLTVKVRNSSLYSLLVQHEKGKLLEQLRKKVPSVDVRNITFRLG
jgi:hypothetical protein